MNVIKAVIEQKKAIKEVEKYAVYSKEWWEKIPSTVTFVDEQMRSMMVFAVVYGSIQL